MEITRSKLTRENCYDFYLKDEDKILSIMFAGNLDLYWTLDIRNTKTNEEIKEIWYKEYSETFRITKENYFIYSLFEDLYEDIKNARIYEREIRKNSDEEIFALDEELSVDNIDDIDTPIKIMTEKEIEERNNEYKERYFYKLLFDGEKVEWHSDEEPYDIANVIVIKKVNDTIELEFIRPELSEGKSFAFNMPGRICIRFRNSGSTYDPFNILFMKMFHKLQDYIPEYHQIHIEEMNYSKKRTLKK